VPAAEAVARGRLGASRGAVAAGLAVIYVVWGSTYLGIKVAEETLPPLLMLSARFWIAGGLLYAFSIRRGDTRGDRPDRRAWRDAGVVAAGLMLGGLGLVALAERTVPTGVAALLIATAPLWMAIFDRAAYGVRLGPLAIAGLAVGFAGVALLVAPTGGGGGYDPRGIVLLLISPVLWSAGTLYTKRAHLPRRPFVGSGMEMLWGALLLGVAGILHGELPQIDLAKVSAHSLLAFLYLVVIGSLVAFSAYVWLLRVAPISLVSTYAYVNPVVAVALGALFEGEPVTVRTLAAGAVIVAGVALIVTSHAKGPPEAEPAH
jgi:drug/metabolite transporter (DMT)-like permease